MRSARWDADGLSVVDVDPGPLSPGFVRLQVEACGICGSDLKLWTLYVSVVLVGAKIAAFAVQYAAFRLLVGSRIRAARAPAST